MPHFYRLLPTRALSRGFCSLARCTWRPLKALLINIYCRLYKIDLQEAERPERKQYKSLDDFFTRALKPEARPLAGNEQTIISPIDGRIMEIGRIRSGRCLQVKGKTYSIEQLLGDSYLAKHYASGIYANFYLAPADYHRIHMPTTAELQHMSYIPGPLMPVKPSVVGRDANILAGNERLVCEFSGACGSMLVVLIGALFVGGMEVSWHPEEIVSNKHPKQAQHWNYANDRITLERGAELGRFHMGSAVVVIFNHPELIWHNQLAAEQSIKMGQALADFN